MTRSSDQAQKEEEMRRRQGRSIAIGILLGLFVLLSVAATAQDVTTMGLVLVDEMPIELGCGQVVEEYLEFAEGEQFKTFRVFAQPGAIVRVSVLDAGQDGDIWEACIEDCAPISNVQTNLALVPQNCTFGNGGTLFYSEPAVADAPNGELCVTVRYVQGIGVWPAHMYVRFEAECIPVGIDLGQAVDVVIGSVLGGETEGSEIFTLPRPLAPGETVSGWGGGTLHYPTQEEWYVFVDLFPGANYEHPVQHVFVNRETGAISDVVESTTPARYLFNEMEVESPAVFPNVFNGMVPDMFDASRAAYAQNVPAGAPAPPTPPAPPASVGQPETNEAPSNVNPQAFNNFVPSGNSLYIYYGGGYTTVASTSLGGYLPVYVDMPSSGLLWIMEYYQSLGSWQYHLYVIPSSGWQQLWFQGDVEGWHSIIAYAGGSWTNWIHVLVGSAPSTCTVSPTSLNFGNVPVGNSSSQTFTITNTSTSLMSGTVFESCGEFNVSPATYSLLPGMSKTFTVTFSPTSGGSKSCTINTSAPCANVVATGAGQSVPSGTCVVSPTSLSFSGVPVGGSSSQTFTITNTGTSLQGGSILEGCPEFSVSPNIYLLGPGSSLTVTVTFSPVSAGTKSCTIANSGACSDVSVVGSTGGFPACSVSPTSLSFGSIPVGSSTAQTFTISNTGTTVLSGLATEGCASFSVSPSSYTLLPGGSATFTVTFAPTTQGTKSCTINLGSSCGSITANGVATPIAACSVAPTALSFGVVPVGGSSAQTFTVTNTGSSMLSGMVSESCASFSVSPTSYTLFPGGSATFTVIFAPGTPGAKSCTINVGGACGVVTASGSGGAVGQKYAILLSGGVDNANNHPRYLNDLTEIYWTLRNVYGYLPSNIYTLYADGTGPAWVTNAATKTNVLSVFSTLQAAMSSSDELFMYVTNHGGQIVSGTNQARIWLWNYESIADWEIANRVNALPGGAEKYFVFEQCYSGGLVDNLAGANRHIATAANWNEVSYASDGVNDQGNGALTFDEFVLHWTAAVTGAYPNGWPLLSNADTNFDTVISLDEAFFYARTWDSATETPQRSNPSGIGTGGL